VAVLLVANSDTGKSSGSSGGGSTVTSSSTTAGHTRTTSTHHHGRVYVVKAGDVLSGIAAKTGVELAVIMRLNPHVDAQSLYPGQRLKLAP